MPAPLIARDAALEGVDRFLDDNDVGGAALVVEGEAGIGKTVVWREAVRRAEARDYGVLSSRPAEAEAKLSYTALADLLSGVDDEVLSFLPGPQRRSLEVVLLRAEAEGGGVDRRALFAAFTGVLRALAGSRPVTLALDDLQWLDASSAAALEFALRRLGDDRIGVLATLRVGDGSSWPAGLMRALGEMRLRRLSLAPLRLAALHLLLKERLGQSVARPALVRIGRASRGNPFYALELARELQRREADRGVGSLPVPEDVLRVVVARIRRLPAATRDALLLAAALSEPDTSLVDVVALHPAEEVGMVEVDADGCVAFAHPLYASAVYRSASAARRRAAHSRLAHAVDDPEERARHLALSSEGADERLAALLDEAAAGANARGAPEAAAELEVQALRLTPSSRDAPALRRRLRLADYLEWAGDSDGARTATRAVIDASAPGVLRAEALYRLAWLEWKGGTAASGVRLAEQALVESAGSRELQARIHRSLANMLGLADVRRMLIHADAIVELVDVADAPLLYAAGVIRRATGTMFLGGPLDHEAIERATQLLPAVTGLSEPEGYDTRSLVANLAIDVDDLSGARRSFLALLAAERELGHEQELAHLLGQLARIEFLAGDWPLAERYAAESVAFAEQTGDEVYAIDAHQVRGLIHSAAGRLDDAGVAVAAALGCVGDTEAGVALATPLWIQGFLAFSANDFGLCDEQLTRATEVLEATGYVEPTEHRFQGDQVEAVIALGDLGRAERLVTRLEERSRVLPRPWTLAVAARSRGLLLAAHGDTDGAQAALEQALAHHDGLEMPFELARTLLVLGQLQRRLGQRRAARATLARGLEIFESLGASLWAERSRAEAARIGVRRAPADLTEGEQRVAELAAQGYTNKEIAGRLFVSRRTVEANLGRAYRKLGIRSRAELATSLAERERRDDA